MEEHWFDKECTERKGETRQDLMKLRRMMMKKAEQSTGRGERRRPWRIKMKYNKPRKQSTLRS